MSKKDYELIATCVRVQTFETPGFEADERTARCIAQAMALEFSLDNPRFDTDRFLAACGL